MRKIALLGALAAVLVVIAPATVTSAVTTARISLSKTKAPPTAQVVVSGQGFAPGESVSVSFDTTVLASMPTDGSGSFSVQVTIPAFCLARAA
jgi:hypothetical protein